MVHYNCEVIIYSSHLTSMHFLKSNVSKHAGAYTLIHHLTYCIHVLLKVPTVWYCSIYTVVPLPSFWYCLIYAVFVWYCSLITHCAAVFVSVCPVCLFCCTVVGQGQRATFAARRENPNNQSSTVNRFARLHSVYFCQILFKFSQVCGGSRSTVVSLWAADQ